MEKIKLFVLGTGWGVPFRTSAPFPLKLETWLRMAGIDYELIVENNPGKGPKKKSPWIEYGNVSMADTELIIEHLSERFDVNLDAHLSERDKGIGLSVRRMLEDHYHQAFEHALFIGRGGAERLAEFAKVLPPVVRMIVPRMFKSHLAKQLYARGLGRHDEETIVRMGRDDLDALSAILGDKPYLLGDEPSSYDACVFGFLGVSVYVEGDNPLYTYGASLPNLMAFCERMRARYFPETLPADAALSA